MASTPLAAIETAIPIPQDRIAEFCRKWKLTELSVFGSVLREDFGEESDVDVLVDYPRDWPFGMFEWMTMQDELQAIFGRRVDLVSRRGMERSRNPFRRNTVLTSAKVVCAA